MMMLCQCSSKTVGSPSTFANAGHYPIALLLALAILLSSCAALPGGKPLPPTVKLSDVEIIKLGISSMELAFTLDVFNPNNYDLPINTLEFVASSEQRVIANGQSNEPVVLSLEGNTPMVINVTAKTSRLLAKLIDSTLSDNALDYNVSGFVKLDNWPARIPFNVDKTLALD